MHYVSQSLVKTVQLFTISKRRNISCSELVNFKDDATSMSYPIEYLEDLVNEIMELTPQK